MNARAILIALLGIGASVASLVRPYWGLLALAVLYFFRPNLWGAEDVVRPVKWLTVAIFVGWLLNEEKAKWLRDAGWLLALLVLYAASAAFAPYSNAESWVGLENLAKVFVVVFLIVRLCQTPRLLSGFVLAMLGGCLWFVKVALGAWAAAGFSGEVRIDTAVGQGGGSNYIAWVLAATLPFLLCKVIRATNWQRWVAAALVPLWVASIVATGSRGGFLCGAAATFTVLLLLRQKRTLLGMALAMLALWLIAPQAYWGRLDTITANPEEMDISSLIRYQNAEASIKIIEDHPLVGTGPGTFPVAKRQYVPANYAGTPAHVMHNTYLQMGSELGLPYFLLFMAITVWLVSRLARRTEGPFRPRDQDDLEWLRVGVLGGLAATAVEMAKGDVGHMDFFWWLYGIAFAHIRIRHRLAEPAVSLPTTPVSLPRPWRA